MDVWDSAEMGKGPVMTLRVRHGATDADQAERDTAGAHLGARQEGAGSARDHPRVLRSHPGDETESAYSELELEDLWDRYGTSVYTLACALLDNETAAVRAVTLGMTDLASSAKSASTNDARRSWARHVYWRSQELAGETSSTPPPPPAVGLLSQLTHIQRACLALCLFGGHTRRQVADLLDLPPTTVADLLTSGLRAVKRLEASGTAACA
jgi:hypothetical protein